MRPLPPGSPPAPPSRLGGWLGAAGIEASPYLVFGAAGTAVGFAVLCGLSLALGRPVALAFALTVAALATFVLAGLVRKAILGSDRHVLLEDVLLVLAAGGLLAWGVGEPVWSTLDLLSTSLGGFLVLGRLGCCASGCCHGRPSAVGAGGAEGPLEGIRLFPIQLVEAAWLLAVTLVSFALILVGAAPGTAVWSWLLLYSGGRFVLEMARGDAARPLLGPLSEAQWTFIALLIARIASEWDRGQLSQPVLVAAAAAGAVVIAGWMTRRLWLDLPRSLVTAADVPGWQRVLCDLERAAREQRGAAVAHAGFEIRLDIDSGDDGREVHAYAIRSEEPLDMEDWYAVGGVVSQRWPAFQLLRASRCTHGSFQLWALVDSGGPAGSTLDDPPLEVWLRARAFAGGLRAWIPPRTDELPAVPALLPPSSPPVSRLSWSLLAGRR